MQQNFSFFLFSTLYRIRVVKLLRFDHLLLQGKSFTFYKVRFINNARNITSLFIKRKRKPMENNIGVTNLLDQPHNVATQRCFLKVSFSFDEKRYET